MHIPVLKKEILEILDLKSGENYIDATLGQGGHAEAILERTIPNGKLLGIDPDPNQIEVSKKNLQLFGNRFIAVKDFYTNIEKIAKENGFDSVDGILFDIGMSSWHIDESGRGFSFLKEEPLDMRFDPDQEISARDIVNTWPEEEIANILKEYGEERFAKNIAKKIVEERKDKPIMTTVQLVEIVKRSFPKFYRFGKKHVAMRTFQALRIAVNDELNKLKEGLEQAVRILNPNGKIAVISFHSLEDRIVKNFFKDNIGLSVLTKKVIQPSEEEIKSNYRSRSAKLRAAIKR